MDITRDALSLALRRMRGSPRPKILDILVDMWGEGNFKEYRKKISDYTEAVRGGDKRLADAVLSSLKKMYYSDVMIDARGLGGAFLRELRTEANQYAVTLYKVFPELVPER